MKAYGELGDDMTNLAKAEKNRESGLRRLIDKRERVHNEEYGLMLRNRDEGRKMMNDRTLRMQKQQ
jgi:hypothetical protein